MEGMKFRLTRSSHHSSRQFNERGCGTWGLRTTLCWAGDFTDEQPLVDGTATGGGATLLARPSGIYSGQRGKNEA